jgi:hypothetical protein
VRERVSKSDKPASTGRLTANVAVIRAGVMGHKSVELGPEVYDKASLADKGDALRLIGTQLVPNVVPKGLAQ